MENEGSLELLPESLLREVVDTFLLAAGLLRLALLDSWSAIATVASVVAIRRVSTTGARRAGPARAARTARTARR